MAKFSRGYFYKEENGKYISPSSWSPGEWKREKLLPSFGLYANLGHKFWSGTTLEFRGYRISVSRFAVRLLKS